MTRFLTEGESLSASRPGFPGQSGFANIQVAAAKVHHREQICTIIKRCHRSPRLNVQPLAHAKMLQLHADGNGYTTAEREPLNIVDDRPSRSPMKTAVDVGEVGLLKSCP